VLDEAIKAMQATRRCGSDRRPHCNIGTAEYNLALGDRRAQLGARLPDQPRHRGDRLRTVSYGEERPKHDNSREETRRLETAARPDRGQP
jgi:flagellar motor protein MotB